MVLHIFTYLVLSGKSVAGVVHCVGNGGIGNNLGCVEYVIGMFAE